MLTLSIVEATRLCRDALLGAGVPGDQAATITDCIMFASERGIDTHGIVSILPATLAGLKAGRIRPHAAVEIVQQGPAVARIDAHQAPGPVAGALGMDTAIERARQFGIGAAVVFNGNHFGAVSFYTDRARRAGMIGLAMCNASPRVAPYLGLEPFLGTNPIAYSAPGADWQEITLDVATSAAAAGKVAKALRRGEQIPPGWAIEPDGTPITDPAHAAGSTFLHFGDHKGYGLAMLVELLTGALAGAQCGLSMPRGGDEAAPQYRSYFFLALNVPSFVPAATFGARVDQLAHEAKAITPVPGAAEVLVPGEPELRQATARQAAGIPFHDGDWKALTRALANHGYSEDWVLERARPTPAALRR